MIKLKREDLTKEILDELIDYDPLTGVQIWKERGLHWFEDTETRTAEHSRKLFKSKNAGKVCFSSTTKNTNYFAGGIQGIPVLAHVVAFIQYHGRPPKWKIRHKDGNPQNNAISNLEEVDASQMMRERKVTNKFGCPGVRMEPNGRFLVRFVLGTYETAEAADEARRLANKLLDYQDRHGKALPE